MTLEAYHTIVGGALGAALGSFLNVLIYRMPIGKSPVGGRSHCPSCRRRIGWQDNVPVLSYLLLRGRCRYCAWRIPPRYVIVEVLSAAAAAAIVWHYGFTLRALWVFAFVAIMLVITLIDWEHQIIPDPLSLGGVVLGWVGALVCLDISFVQSLVGSIVGGGMVLFIAILYKAVRKIDGMGGGDVKLMAMIGAFLGWQMVFPVLFIAALLGSVYGLTLMRSGSSGKTAVAFGSFLAPASCIMLFAGQRILSLYLGR